MNDCWNATKNTIDNKNVDWTNKTQEKSVNCCAYMNIFDCIKGQCTESNRSQVISEQCLIVEDVLQANITTLKCEQYITFCQLFMTSSLSLIVILLIGAVVFILVISTAIVIGHILCPKHCNCCCQKSNEQSRKHSYSHSSYSHSRSKSKSKKQKKSVSPKKNVNSYH